MKNFKTIGNEKMEEANGGWVIPALMLAWGAYEGLKMAERSFEKNRAEAFARAIYEYEKDKPFCVEPQ